MTNTVTVLLFSPPPFFYAKIGGVGGGVRWGGGMVPTPPGDTSLV